MYIQLPKLTTCAALAKIAGTSHGVVGRLVLAGKIKPVAVLLERGRDILLYDPAAAGDVAALLLDEAKLSTEKK